MVEQEIIVSGPKHDDEQRDYFITNDLVIVVKSSVSVVANDNAVVKVLNEVSVPDDYYKKKSKNNLMRKCYSVIYKMVF